MSAETGYREDAGEMGNWASCACPASSVAAMVPRSRPRPMALRSAGSERGAAEVLMPRYSREVVGASVMSAPPTEAAVVGLSRSAVSRCALWAENR